MARELLKPMVENILAPYRAARPEQIAAGLAWYADAHTFALAISNGDLVKGAGVIAALSPQTSWAQNMTLASRAFVEGFASGQTGDNKAKADRILNGEHPDDVLGWNNPKAKSGHKVRNFYRNIVDPTGPEVTIDRHAFDIAVGYETDSATRGQLGRVGQYDLFADTYCEAARVLGVPPAVAQSITWLVWREAKGLDLD
jgi:hypothetical protein